jgi:hypothetical protein
MPTKHSLGFGDGKLIEYEDGSVGYIPTGSFSQAFRVQIADVTGFSVTKGNRMLERTLNVLGNGTVLASTGVSHGSAEKIEAWFRGHPLFGQRTAAPAAEAPSSELVADELRKLADLRDAGVLTDDEFAAQKAKLLG